MNTNKKLMGISKTDFLTWHEQQSGPPRKLLIKVYKIFKKAKLSEDMNVDVCWDKLSNEDKLKIALIIKR